jgi:hypothetical protein
MFFINLVIAIALSLGGIARNDDLEAKRPEPRPPSSDESLYIIKGLRLTLSVTRKEDKMRLSKRGL